MLSIEHASHWLEAEKILGFEKMKEILLRLRDLPSFWSLKSMRIKLDENCPLDKWQYIQEICEWAEDNRIKVCLTYPLRYTCNMFKEHETDAEWVRSKIFVVPTWWTINQPWITPMSNNDFDYAKRRVDEFVKIFGVDKYLHTITYNCPDHWIEYIEQNHGGVNAPLGMTIYYKSWTNPAGEVGSYQESWEKYFELQSRGFKIILNEANLWLGEKQEDGTIKWNFGEDLWKPENIDLAYMVIGHSSMMAGELVQHCFAHPTYWGLIRIDRKNNKVEYHPILKRLIGGV